MKPKAASSVVADFMSLQRTPRPNNKHDVMMLSCSVLQGLAGDVTEADTEWYPPHGAKALAGLLGWGMGDVSLARLLVWPQY